MPLKIVVPRTLSPKSIKKVNTPKSLMINEKNYKNEPPKLRFAAGVGGIPPEGNDNLPSSIKKTMSPDELKKIIEITKDMNNFTRKAFDIFNKHFKYKK